MRERFRSDLDHRILAVAYHSTGTAVAAVTEHAIRVPLQHSSGSEDAKRLWRGGEAPATVEVFFSVVEKLSKENEWLHELQNQPLSPRERAELYVKNAALRDADSLCLFLQGGPGFGAPVPVAGLGLGKDSSWASAALDACGYSRIVLLDQRGTGRSTPVTKQWIEMNYPDLFLLDGDDKPTSTANTLEEWRAKDSDRAARVQVAVDQVTEYLSSFRCDSIVRDAELVRQALLLDPDDVAAAAADASQSLSRPTPRPWGGALGQSFGGFCLLSYLSSVEHPPRIALFTGGIPPMLTPLTEVYRKLWDRVKERSLRYYDMYPDDVPVVKNIVRRLLEEAPVLPSGGSLTARRFLQLGLRLGSAPPSFAVIHAMISSAFVPGSSTTLSRPFLKAIEMEQSFDDHPIYFWLHEPSCYADGNFSGATNWAAHRVYQELIASEDSEWDYSRTCLESDPRPVLWFGEHVFPWMAEDYGELKGAGLAAVAEALAQKADWGPLFDGNKIRECLASKRSRAAAAVYYEDMYVEFEASVKVAERGGPLEKCKLYITNEYQHSGLRDDGAKMFSKLYGMATGTVRTPS
jgi:pimeloyl-ACP methyl ester carboxylesterase